MAEHLISLPASAHNLFTRAYMIPDNSDPGCMRLFWQTDTALHGGWVKWGYHEDHLDNLEDATPEHQNIKNEVHTGQRAQDFIRWDAGICAAPGVPIWYKIYISEQQDYDDGKAVYTIGPGWFVPPLPPAARHLTFFGYGDNRNGDKFDSVSSWLKGNVENDPVNRKTFLLHSGDICYNGGQTFEQYKDTEWSHYFHKFESARDVLSWMPVMAAQGNHDFNWEGHYETPKYFFTNWPYPQYVDSIGMVPYINDDGKLVSKSDDGSHPKKSVSDAYYSFDYGPVHVAVVNTYSEFNDWDHLGGCSIGDGLKKGHTEYNWLKADLNGSTKPWKLLLMHVSPLSCDCYITDDVRRDLEDLADAAVVDLIVSGHDHYYKRSQSGSGLWHLVLGGAGAPLDCGDSCKICAYHYARFHVVNDGELKIEVFGHYDEGGSPPFYDTLTITRTAPVTTSADFEVSQASADYRYPRRFSCSSPGVHTYHKWDFGDGAGSTEENPLHTYPKPTDPSGIATYTASLSVSTDGVSWLPPHTKKITVYNKGALEPIVNVGQAEYAVFLRPTGTPLDESADFRGIYWYPGNPQLEVKPGDYTLTIRALGYHDWEGNVTVPPGGGVMPQIYPQPITPLNATVAIGSVPTGADVTVALGTTVHTGTTPFYKEICCTDEWEPTQCTFDYTVKKGAIEIKGVGDLFTRKTEDGCESEFPGEISNVYVVLHPSGAEEGRSGLVIMSQPSDQKVIWSGRARARVSARSRRPLTYRWYCGESGDTSHPVYGATGPEIITPPLRGSEKGWVRVHAGVEYADSPTVHATVVPPKEGPVLFTATRACGTPKLHLCVYGLDQTDIGENRVFFDELEGIVDAVDGTGCDVTAPLMLASREYVYIQMKVDGVWSNALRVKVRDCR